VPLEAKLKLVCFVCVTRKDLFVLLDEILKAIGAGKWKLLCVTRKKRFDARRKVVSCVSHLCHAKSSSFVLPERKSTCILPFTGRKFQACLFYTKES
jgi:hypothetical protein